MWAMIVLFIQSSIFIGWLWILLKFKICRAMRLLILLKLFQLMPAFIRLLLLFFHGIVCFGRICISILSRVFFKVEVLFSWIIHLFIRYFEIILIFIILSFFFNSIFMDNRSFQAVMMIGLMICSFRTSFRIMYELVWNSLLSELDRRSQCLGWYL